ncbi:MAG: Fic family protein [Verrucomicrobiota bacterium]
MSPPFQITAEILALTGKIERRLGRLEGFHTPKPQPQLRKSNRVRTLQGSLAIEGNSLELEQVTALLDGKKILGPKDDIAEILNANQAYEQFKKLNPLDQKHLLKTHRLMMKGLIPDAGKWRSSNVGIQKKGQITHMAPPARRVPALMAELFSFLEGDDHQLIQGCVFHYESEFIHPFSDGNGRLGRFWHTLLLYRFHRVFEYIPVESIIQAHQQEYYNALETSDNAGESTHFIEFSLQMILEALEEFLSTFRSKAPGPNDRLDGARAEFRKRWFTRKDYLTLHKTISTATASRDLKAGVTQDLLEIEGMKAVSRYRFL